MAYIGNGPGVASQRILTTLTAVDGQTTFVPSAGYTLGYVDVFLNGVKLVDGTDYTAANGVNIVLTEAAALNDTVEVVTYFPRGLSDGYTKAEADGRYEPIDSAYTKSESDARYMDINAVTLPDQTGHTGQFLQSDGTNADWATVDLTSKVSKTGDTMTGTLALPTVNATGEVQVSSTLLADASRLRIPSSATEPANPQNGDLYYNSANDQVYVRVNNVWTSVTASMPTGNLQFWLPLQGNTDDASGNNRNGSASGVTYTSGPSGSANSAALFTSGDTLTVAYTAPSTYKTLAFWYKASWNSDVDAFKIGFQGNATGNGFMFMQGVGAIADLGFWGYGATHDYNIGTSFTNIWVSNNQWHHVAAIWNGSSSLVYLDGVAQNQYFNGSTSSTMNLGNTQASTFVIGGASSDVEVSGVAVWDRVLSAAEITSVKDVTGA